MTVVWTCTTWQEVTACLVDVTPQEVYTLTVILTLATVPARLENVEG